MKNKKKTFMFIKKNMSIGGIETYLMRTIKQLKSNGHRVIWILPEGGHIDKGFKSQLMDGSVEIINVDLCKFSWINDLYIRFGENEEVCALAFSLFDFTFIEMIKKKYKEVKIDSFFWVPHFKERGIFIEEFAPKLLQPILRKYIGKIIYSMEKNNNIFYVNKSHLDALTSTYGYKVIEEENKLLKGFSREVLPFDNNLALKRSEREVFNIITVGRFHFPHKAYIIGLIKVYGELKKKYDKLKLTIIGYGKDENRVIKEIEKLSPEAQKDANLIGKVAYGDLRKYFENANMSIGVAGAIVDGAVTGLISVPVRHYTERCEGYGYLPQSKNCLVSSEPGRLIEEFIEEVINMDKQKYLELSKKAFDTYAAEDIGKATDNLLKMSNKNWKRVISSRAIFFIRTGFKFGKIIKNYKNN